MKTTRDVLDYLQIEGLHLHNLIGENNSDFNQGRLYVMNKIINSVRDIIEIEEYEESNYKNLVDELSADIFNEDLGAAVKTLRQYGIVED